MHRQAPGLIGDRRGFPIAEVDPRAMVKLVFHISSADEITALCGRPLKILSLVGGYNVDDDLGDPTGEPFDDVCSDCKAMIEVGRVGWRLMSRRHVGVFSERVHWMP